MLVSPWSRMHTHACAGIMMANIKAWREYTEILHKWYLWDIEEGFRGQTKW